ncbi:uncharacterized protein [Lepeophtheirus salmonis]|uniref:MD-2-related lipid-recognition domain-containing protein n=1 Tax=Lepeophtheirus salmonis TaxID=72036 RepID=A0A0K2TYF5_LEPSM|nr:uncharacterized protein LOC121117789 [Lepeophtheirus salmonis]
MNPRIISGVFLLIFLADVQGKICWKECTEMGIISSADIDGCHRRSGRDGRTPRFRCKGIDGPPCTVIRGETVHLNLEFRPNRVLKNVTQAAYWESSFGMDIPWAGLATNACTFMVNNEGCKEGDQMAYQSFSYPIFINEMYPPGTYNLRWEFTSRNEKGMEDSLSCFRYVIRIV